MKTALRIGSMALAMTIMTAYHPMAQPLSGQVCGVEAPVLQIPPILQAPPGNKLSFHVFAKGFQIYRCIADKTDSSRFVWVFVAPAADLFTHPNDKHPVGRHYAGPTWESKDNSKVTGTKLQQADAPDTNAIPWLLLRSASVSGSGIFGKITFIQRTNTKGGKMPSVPADRTHSGQEARIPYMAEYYFYEPQ